MAMNTFLFRITLWSLVSLCIYAQQGDLKVEKGQLTFDAEGNDNPSSAYFSRQLHVPSKWSGVTIGRGYDIKYKKRHRVIKDLKNAGVSSYYAKKIAQFVGKAGEIAKVAIKFEDLESFTITRRQQKNLFRITYARQEREAARLSRKYYKINWGNLHPKIKEILVDLKFRGDFRPTRKSVAMNGVKLAVLKNSVSMLKAVMSNRKIWRSVPYDRFRRRKNAF